MTNTQEWFVVQAVTSSIQFECKRHMPSNLFSWGMQKSLKKENRPWEKAYFIKSNLIKYSDSCLKNPFNTAWTI